MSKHVWRVHCSEFSLSLSLLVCVHADERHTLTMETVLNVLSLLYKVAEIFWPVWPNPLSAAELGDFHRILHVEDGGRQPVPKSGFRQPGQRWRWGAGKWSLLVWCLLKWFAHREVLEFPRIPKVEWHLARIFLIQSSQLLRWFLENCLFVNLDISVF